MGHFHHLTHKRIELLRVLSKSGRLPLPPPIVLRASHISVWRTRPSVAISNGGKRGSRSDMCAGALLTFVKAEVGRFEPCDCARMFVAQMVELSHRVFCNFCFYFFIFTFLCSRPRPKKQSGGRHGIPPQTSCRAVRHNFFEIATEKKTVERS